MRRWLAMGLGLAGFALLGFLSTQAFGAGPDPADPTASTATDVAPAQSVESTPAKSRNTLTTVVAPSSKKRAKPAAPGRTSLTIRISPPRVTARRHAPVPAIPRSSPRPSATTVASTPAGPAVQERAKQQYRTAPEPKPKPNPRPNRKKVAAVKAKSKPRPKHVQPLAAHFAFPPSAEPSSTSSSSGFILVGLLGLAFVAFAVAALPPLVLERTRVLSPLVERRVEAAVLGVTLALATGFAYLLVSSG